MHTMKMYILHCKFNGLKPCEYINLKNWLGGVEC